MVFNGGGNNIIRNSAGYCTIFALNGRIYFGGTDSTVSSIIGTEINFAEDCADYFAVLNNRKYLGNISERNAGKNQAGPSGRIDAIVNTVVNDVAATVLEGAEIGALGLPIPTVAVATAGGISVIHANGSVYDIADEAGTRPYTSVAIRDNNYVLGWSTNNATAQSWRLSNLFADQDVCDFRYSRTNDVYFPHTLGGYPQKVETGGDSVFTGGANGLSVIKENLGNPFEGAVAYITSAYNTGYMVGDIRGALLANTALYDRSVKANTLTQSGTLTDAVVATGAELKAYGGWSASNYLSKAYDADFDFADGKFSVMCWVKVVAGSTYQSICHRYHSGTGGKGWQLYLDGSEKAYMNVHGASSVSTGLTDVLSDGWHLICGVSDGAKVKIYADGVLANSATLAAGDLTNSSAKLTVGIAWDEAGYPFAGSLSLLRISATVPTPKQIKAIFDEEKVLFRSGAKCLLAASQVNDLAYDKTSGLLHVASESTASSKSFRGLEAVESLTSDGSLGLTAATEVDGITAAGGVLAAYDNAKAGVNLPALDVRAELLEGESKIPDDGKFHFEGVTASTATPTVIGQIPVAENETVNATIKVTGTKVNGHDTSYRFIGEIRQSFSRKIGGDVVEETQAYKLTESDSTTPQMDCEVATGPQTIKIKVTGHDATQMIWKASVEVQRISEKTYER
jgi:hypothetical protein